MFLTKYEKSTDDTKVLLMYLRLNDYDLSKVKRLEQVEENRQFDLKIKKNIRCYTRVCRYNNNGKGN